MAFVLQWRSTSEMAPRSYKVRLQQDNAQSNVYNRKNGTEIILWAQSRHCIPHRLNIVIIFLTHWPLGNFNEIFKHILVIDDSDISCLIAISWKPQVQVMAWCREATSHYLSQCWPISMSPYGITRPQWVKWLCYIRTALHYIIFMVCISYKRNTTHDICMYWSHYLWPNIDMIGNVKSHHSKCHPKIRKNGGYVYGIWRYKECLTKKAISEYNHLKGKIIKIQTPIPVATHIECFYHDCMFSKLCFVCWIVNQTEMMWFIFATSIWGIIHFDVTTLLNNSCNEIHNHFPTTNPLLKWLTNATKVKWLTKVRQVTTDGLLKNQVNVLFQ